MTYLEDVTGNMWYLLNGKAEEERGDEKDPWTSDLEAGRMVPCPGQERQEERWPELLRSKKPPVSQSLGVSHPLV